MNCKKLLKFLAAAVVLCLALTGQAFAADASQNIATRAAGVSVRGRVTSYLPGVSCTVQLRQGDAVRYSTASFPGSGAGLGTQEFIIPGVADGIYDLVITKPGHLNYTIRNIVVQGSDVDLTTNDNDLVSDITLVAGDINGDGCVDLQDLIALTSSDNFGKSPVVTVFDNGAADNPEDLTGLDDFIYETTATGIRITGVKDKTKTAYVIPDGVTSIGDSAFWGCTSLTSVTIPDSVTSIGDATFWNCTSLTNISIPANVTNIGKAAFEFCENLRSITIPDGVTSIGDDAFKDCARLTSITIPNSVMSIGENAFSGCASLFNVYITDIEAWCKISFSDGTSNPLGREGNLYLNGVLVTNVVIPDGIQTIDCTFYGCTSLTSVTIPSSVTSVGWGAFAKCTNLTNITIPDSVTSIGNYAFRNCTSLTNITYGGTKAQWDAITKGTDWDYNTGNYTITYEGESTGLDDFYYETTEDGITITGVKDNTKTEYVIPDGVTSIGESAFYSCSGLMSITIPDSVTSIGEKAFYNCYNLTSITIPDGVTSIGESAFESCLNMTNVTIPGSVTSIGEYAFFACESLQNIEVAATNEVYTSINGNLYTKNGQTLIQYATGKTDTQFTVPDGVTHIGKDAFFRCMSLTSVVIPDSVISIGNSAFETCTSLESISIPDSVTSIGYYAFNNCTSLTSVTIPDSVTSMGYHAFYGCKNLTSITYGGTKAQWDAITEGTYWDKETGEYTITYEGEPDGLEDFIYETTENGITITGVKDNTKTEYIIPDSVTNIDTWAFSDCSSLTSITIPDSVTSIGVSAFEDCTSLTSVTIGNGVTSIGGAAFRDCTSLTSITIPDSVTTIGYDAFSYCSSLTSITIPDSVTSIGNSAFFYCSSLTSVTIPDSVTSIGWHAFYGCSSLTSVTIPDSVTKLGVYAFSYCSSLTSVTIGNGVTSIGDLAFYNCSSLTSITIPDSVTTIGYDAFSYCSSLTSVTIPNSVTKLGGSAFSRCSSLTSITIPDSVTSIGDSAFSYCSSLTSITIPDSVTKLGANVFNGCTSLTSIKFRGTKAQWEAITKGDSWASNTGSFTVTYNYTGE